MKLQFDTDATGRWNEIDTEWFRKQTIQPIFGMEVISQLMKIIAVFLALPFIRWIILDCIFLVDVVVFVVVVCQRIQYVNLNNVIMRLKQIHTHIHTQERTQIYPRKTTLFFARFSICSVELVRFELQSNAAVFFNFIFVFVCLNLFVLFLACVLFLGVCSRFCLFKTTTTTAIATITPIKSTKPRKTPYNFQMTHVRITWRKNPTRNHNSSKTQDSFVVYGFNYNWTTDIKLKRISKMLANFAHKWKRWNDKCFVAVMAKKGSRESLYYRRQASRNDTRKTTKPNRTKPKHREEK